MRRSILDLALALLVSVTLAGCAEEVIPTGPAPTARSNDGTPLPGGEIPKPLSRLGPEDFIDIAAGDYHTCARKVNGKVYCWGRDDAGQAGNPALPGCGVGSCVNRPTLLWKANGKDSLRATQVDAGRDHTCALESTGAVWCWGAGGQGQLGNGGTANSTQPRLVSGRQLFSSIGAGTNSSCATSTNGMYCWGTLQGTAYPKLVSSYNGYSSVVVGDKHACTMETFGSYRAVDCWGDNPEGQIGIEPAQMPYGPFTVRAQFGTEVSRVVTQTTVTCVDQVAGTVQCVGDNSFYQLGQPSSMWYSGTPQTIGGGQLLHGVSAGSMHVCALDLSSQAWCWGMGFFGQLGNNNHVDSQTPQAATGGHAFRAIAAGYQHTCGIGTDNHIYCWGYNDFGQLGAGLMNSWIMNPVQALDP